MNHIKEQIVGLVSKWMDRRKRVPSFIGYKNDYYWNQWLPHTDTPCDQIIYLLGDSWMVGGYRNVHLMRKYPHSCVINRSFPGGGNGDMIKMLEQDSHFLKQIDLPITVFVAFSEIGRNQQEIDTDKIKDFRCVNDYLVEVQRYQFQKIKDLSNQIGAKSICTTAYVPNTVNSNPSIIDFIKKKNFPNLCFNLTSKFYSWFYDNGHMPVSGLINDIDRVDSYVLWLTGHEEIDETAHIKPQYDHDVYKTFFDHYFPND